MPLNVEVQLNPSYHKKIGANYKNIIDKALLRTALESEKICKEEAPVLTGNLRRNIHATHFSFMTAGLSVGEAAYYWIFLQYGTKKMGANPFVTRTYKQVISKKLIKKNVDDMLRSEGII